MGNDPALLSPPSKVCHACVPYLAGCMRARCVSVAAWVRWGHSSKTRRQSAPVPAQEGPFRDRRVLGGRRSPPCRTSRTPQPAVRDKGRGVCEVGGGIGGLKVTTVQLWCRVRPHFGLTGRRAYGLDQLTRSASGSPHLSFFLVMTLFQHIVLAGIFN